jgi:hypothetical protein
MSRILAKNVAASPTLSAVCHSIKQLEDIQNPWIRQCEEPFSLIPMFHLLTGFG